MKTEGLKLYEIHFRGKSLAFKKPLELTVHRIGNDLDEACAGLSVLARLENIEIIDHKLIYVYDWRDA